MVITGGGLQEKMEVQGSLDKASGKVKDLITLEMKLEQALEVKRSKLAEKDPEYTAFGDFRDEDAGIRITCAASSNQTVQCICREHLYRFAQQQHCCAAGTLAFKCICLLYTSPSPRD